MAVLKIEATERTPSVELSGPPWKLTLSGESYPEDVSAFYGQVILAVDDIVQGPAHPLHVELSMVYINSSSIKALYRIFEGLDGCRQKGWPVQVVWRYTDDDDIMQELGEDFQERFPELGMLIEAH